jgi:Spy/CpxP family protein refolding chaperone
MSLRTKFFAGIFAVSAFAVAGYTQDTSKEAEKKVDTTTKTRPEGWVGDGIRKGQRGGGFGRMGRGLFGIELTEAQKADIRKILEANKPDRAALQEVRTLAKAKWEGTITADQQARLDALRAEAKAKAKSVHEQLQAVLTDEQKAQIEQRKQEMKAKMQEMRQKMKERHQPRQKDSTKTTTEPGKTN